MEKKKILEEDYGLKMSVELEGRMNDLVGQLSFFNEAEACCDENAAEPAIDDVIDESLRKPRKPKQKGQREEDLKDFPQECHTHDVSNKAIFSKKIHLTKCSLIKIFKKELFRRYIIKSHGHITLNRLWGGFRRFFRRKNFSLRCSWYLAIDKQSAVRA